MHLNRSQYLSEQALDKCPVGEVHQLFHLYAKFEEEHGVHLPFISPASPIHLHQISTTSPTHLPSIPQG